MTKRYLFIAAGLLSFTANAQTELLKGKQEIAVSYGYGTHEMVRDGWGSIPYKSMSEGSDGYLRDDMTANLFGSTTPYAHFNDKQYAGALFVNYYFSPVSWISVGIGSGLEMHRAGLTTADPDPAIKREIRIGSYTRRAFTVAPELRLAYGRKPLVNFYALLGLGSTFAFERVENDATGQKITMNDNYFTFQVTPFGIRLGKKLSGFAELGYGYKGIMRLGASYKF